MTKVAPVVSLVCVALTVGACTFNPKSKTSGLRWTEQAVPIVP